MFPNLNSVNEAYPHVDNKTKRLLTIDQVNKEFPVMMYKVWKATRERDGLLGESRITTHSVNSNPDTTIHAALERSDASIALKCSQKPETAGDTSRSSTDKVQVSNTMASSVLSIRRDCETKTDDLPLRPSSQIGGVVEETCAICLEVPEDNDDVRSLKCGHCYHQACIDPWLTSQRGACPLCKRDYYHHPQQSVAERGNTLLWTANEDRSPQETRELNTRVENTHRTGLAPPPPALTRASWVHQNDSWNRMHTSLPLPLYSFRRNLGENEDGPSQLERGEL